MDVNVKDIPGEWDLGYSLDWQTLSSIPIGHNAYGYMQYETTRPPIGEALFQLKYRSDYSQIPLIAAQMATTLAERFQNTSLVIPMPASRVRARQPVAEIAREYARIMGLPCIENLLVKTTPTAALKDMRTKEEREAALLNAFTCNNVLVEGTHNVLIIDDLYDTGASLEAATRVLRSYPRVGQIYVATVTRR
ncbi:hypothetical protein SAMN05192566_1565 [Methylophilus rhizosphaerae]|uniref:ComF family protein n=1 Tax=Methylophilus rhizosphaerae TaxID=492660 RepID=A0A1G9CPV7_9PROT|nr:ComF family protein [Methylophilus rhizosphaerae]SDK53616.1 hypothetical protein SAMN05192566_1565 [Methylophilus rhizosphaerae]